MILMWGSQTKPLIIINKIYKVLRTKLMKTIVDVSSIIRAVIDYFSIVYFCCPEMSCDVKYILKEEQIKCN